jgi:serine protease SohB
MEFWQAYGLFLAKTLTLLIVLTIALAAIMAAGSRGRQRGRDRLEVRRLNDRYHAMELALQRQLLAGRRLKQFLKLKGKERKSASARLERRLFVLDFRGDMRASQVESLRHEVSGVLTVAKPEDEVVVRVETGGGVIHGYGLAAAQLVRIREAGIPLTVTVDKIAASGGYMLACVGNKILAAPFAIVGSIGVIGQLPNFHRLLKRHDIDFELQTAGQYKRTLTVFGENTPEGRAKYREELEEAHALFKSFIGTYRPQLDLERVATGEHWFGETARELGLVDALGTSDDYLLAASREATLLEVKFVHKEALSRRLTLAFETTVQRLLGLGRHA